MGEIDLKKEKELLKGSLPNDMDFYLKKKARNAIEREGFYIYGEANDGVYYVKNPKTEQKKYGRRHSRIEREGAVDLTARYWRRNKVKTSKLY